MYNLISICIQQNNSQWRKYNEMKWIVTACEWNKMNHFILSINDLSIFFLIPAQHTCHELFNSIWFICNNGSVYYFNVFELENVSLLNRMNKRRKSIRIHSYMWCIVRQRGKWFTTLLASAECSNARQLPHSEHFQLTSTLSCWSDHNE